mgnify:CR=1 FL=1
MLKVAKKVASFAANGILYSTGLLCFAQATESRTMNRSSQPEWEYLREGEPAAGKEKPGVERAEQQQFITLPTLPLASQTGTLMWAALQNEGTESTDMQDARRTKDESSPTVSPERAPLTGVRAPVLIVEDTVELAEVIQATIEAMGLSTIVANHGIPALDHLKTRDLSLLLLDIGLPDISGWEMLKTLKEHYKNLNRSVPPIIIITAYGDPANRLVGKLQEVNAYLIKPFTPDQVEGVVYDVLTGVKPPSANLA